MNKKLNRILAFALVLCMSTAMLIGCSGAQTPQEKIAAALSATFAEVNAISEPLEYDMLTELYFEKPMTQTLKLLLSSADTAFELEPFYGTGFEMTASSDLSNRTLSTDMNILFAGDHLGTMQIVAEDSKMYIGIPELFNETVLLMDTEDLPADVAQASGMDGYNLFDMVQQYADMSALTTEVKTAYDALFTASEVTEGEEVDITIDGTAITAEKFSVVLKPADIAVFLRSLGTSILENEQLKPLIESTLVSYLGYSMTTEELHEGYSEFVNELEAGMTDDISLDFFLSDGFLRSAVLEYQQLTLEMMFGAQQVADYFEFNVFETGSTEKMMEIISKGNHDLTGEDGNFTDRTDILFYDIYSGEMAGVTLVTDYDPKGGDYEFEFVANAGYEAYFINSEGNLKMTDSSFDMIIDDLTIEAGTVSFSFSGEYSIKEGEYKSELDKANAVMMNDMTQDEMLELNMVAQQNISTIIGELLSKHPELMEMFGYGF